MDLLKILKAFFKRCLEVSLKIGEFDKMENERAPSFIRFILQRIFFLVLKTKLSFSNSRNVNIHD